MIEPRGDRDLAQEAIAGERPGEVGPEHLDGDLPVVFEVVREVDRGHAAGAEFALNAVVAGEGGRETRSGVRHARARGRGFSGLDQCRSAWQADEFAHAIGRQRSLRLQRSAAPVTQPDVP